MRLLLITYHFPPLLSSESIVIGKLFGALSRTGLVQIDVITVAVGHSNFKIDPGLLDLLPGNLAIYRIPSFESWIFYKIYTRYFPKRTKIPDNLFIWRFLATKAARKLFNKNSYDYIVAGVNPISCAIVGIRSKDLKGNNSRLIMLINDPVARNPFKLICGFHKMKMMNIEKEIVTKADLLLFPCPELRDYFLNPYPDKESINSCIIPHSYEPSFFINDFNAPITPSYFKYSENQIHDELGISIFHRNSQTKIMNKDNTFFLNRHNKNKIRLAHIGDAGTNARKFDILLEAIDYLSSSILHSVEFYFIGQANPHIVKSFEKIKSVVFNNIVPYRESLKKMQEYDVLLLMDADVDRSFFFPGKLPDYLKSGRPIIAITHPSSCVSRILGEHQAMIIAPNDPRGLAQAIVDLVKDRWPSGKRIRSGISKYSSKKVAEQFYKALKYCD
jgi:hypothetical protein